MSVRAKWASAILLGLVIVCAAIFHRPLRVEWHKWRLQALKEQRERYMRGRLSAFDKVWLHMTGKPGATSDLEANLQRHEDALVKLGFLDREAFEVANASSADEIRQALAPLRTECPWYHAQTISSTNAVVTACPGLSRDA